MQRSFHGFKPTDLRVIFHSMDRSFSKENFLEALRTARALLVLALFYGMLVFSIVVVVFLLITESWKL